MYSLVLYVVWAMCLHVHIFSYPHYYYYKCTHFFNYTGSNRPAETVFVLHLPFMWSASFPH